MTDYERKIIALIDRIEAPKVRAMMRVCQENRKYPLDCLTDGALEILVNHILSAQREEY